MCLFDSHCHINDEYYDNNRDEIINDIIRSGVKKFTIAGWNVDSSILANELASKYDFIYGTAGISPNDVYDINRLEELERIIALYNVNNLMLDYNNPYEKEQLLIDKTKCKIVAVGEIGLDYYWNKDNKIQQQELFIRQIELANKYSLPIQIHTRDASVDTIKVLKEHPVKKKGIFHCCPHNQELIKAGVELGFYISFSGNITFKNAKKADTCISIVPMDKILIETDSPYMTPVPYRGQRNNPKNVTYVAEKIASVKGMQYDEVVKATYINACNIFDIEK